MTSGLTPLLQRLPDIHRSLPSIAPRHTVRPEHSRSLPSMAPRHTVRPEHSRSLPSMAPRHTVRPEHKKGVRVVEHAGMFDYSDPDI